MKKYYILREVEDSHSRAIEGQFEIEELTESENGKLMISPFLYVDFKPESGILFANPVNGYQYVDLMSPFNQAGSYHPFAKILRGETPPNGQKCEIYKLDPSRGDDALKLSHSFVIRYDSIFDFGFITDDNRECRGADKLMALHQAIEA